MDSVRKLDRAMLKRVATWKQKSFLIISPPPRIFSIDTIHAKSIHIKLTITEASIYVRLCYQKYVESSRQ